MTPIIGDVIGIIGEIADAFVNTIDTDRGEVVTKRTEVAFRVREKSLINMALNNLALDLETRLSQIQEVIQAIEKALLIAFKEIA